ncbi:elastin-like [Carassius carassius]|uniref:elastin-like n=1 Tax=Carassius carassius TaxID=217509 RepID=UPI00286907C5|nr:elastin-like [Carassius carassius]
MRFGGGDSRRQEVTLGELDRAVEGPQAISRTGVCFFLQRMNRAPIFDLIVKYTCVFIGPGGVYPYGYGPFPGSTGAAGIGTGVLPGAKPLKAPGVGGAGSVAGVGAGLVPGAGGGYPSGVGVGAGAKPPKPGYGSLGTGYAQQGGVAPGGYGGYPHAYPGGYGAGLSPQQAKAAKYGGGLTGFLGAGYRGGAGCQGKYCGRRRK